jgi:hypothetical protein
MRHCFRDDVLPEVDGGDASSERKNAANERK